MKYAIVRFLTVATLPLVCATIVRGDIVVFSWLNF